MYKILFLVIFLGISSFTYLSCQKTTINTPLSTKNQTKNNFEKLIADKNIDISNTNFDSYNHLISFDFYSDKKATKVIMSDQKNIWLQLNALQKIDKMVKIKNRSLLLVDLSLKHPYATIKNN